MNLVGRELETTAVIQALDRSGAVLLVGAAGIGKTAVWREAVEMARLRGETVLTTRATDAEALLPWVGLTDLLVGPPGEMVDELPAPQARALRAVMLQAGDDAGLDVRAVGTGLLSLLQGLSASAPVLLAVDDLPHLDAASAAALGFALRRLPERTRVRLLATARESPNRPVSALTVPDEQVYVLALGGLTVGAVFELLLERLDTRLPRPLLLRVHEASGGNPLYALELARALIGSEIAWHPGEPLSVPTGLSALVDARVRGLPPAERRIVAATAAAWRLTDDGIEPDLVERLRRLGFVDVEPSTAGPGTVRAHHPLLGATAYAELSAGERRELHGWLAGRTEDAVERARHLALSATGPDAGVADALDEGVMAALAAGIPDLAADLAQLALELTADHDERPRRLDRLADARLRAGGSAGALRAEEEAIGLTHAAPERARRRVRAAEIRTEVEGWSAAERELQVAVTEAADDPEILAEVLLTVAAVTDDIALADASASRALELLEALPAPDPQILSGAIGQAAGAAFRAGRGLDHEKLARAMELERQHAYRRLSDRVDAGYAALLKYADDLDAAEELLLSLVDEARSVGDVSSIAYALGHLVQVYAWSGRLEQAAAVASEHLDVAVQGGLAAQLAQAEYNVALVQSYRGELRTAEDALTALRDGAEPGSWARMRAAGALGFVAMSRPDAETAVGHLDLWHQMLTAMHFEEPGYTRCHLDYVTALVGVGRLADAEGLCSQVARQAERSGRGSAAAVARTGQALLASEAGDFDRAVAGVEGALAWYDATPLRFDRARTLLLAGRIRRRAKAKSAARDLLEQALGEFASFGAVAWVEQVEAELARVNVRPRAPEELTETERLVAEHAAAGLSNREIAGRTFLSVKTVEANLSRVYRKLDVRSRAQLAARLSQVPATDTPR